MDWVETTGRTVDEAKKSALEQLGVEEADAEFEVVAEPKVGLFGRLKEEARVRARVQPRYPRSKGERRDRKRRRGSSAPEQPVRATTPAVTTGEEEGTETAGRPREPKPSRSDDSPGRASNQASGARRRRRTGGPTSMTDQSEQESNTSSDTSSASSEEQARLAEDFLRGLLDEFGAEATITSDEEANGFIEVLITGEGLGTLIGPKGATLLALQELTRIVVQRHASPSDSRVVVDVNGYRKRRQEALTRFAQQVASEVRASNKSRALEPMPPADRKVVHDAVNAIPGVSTISQGEEPYRRVVLVPVATEENAEEADGTAEAQAVGS